MLFQNYPQLLRLLLSHKAGKVIYVGKAKDIKQRVTAIFLTISVTKQKQDFFERYLQILLLKFGTELMAAILESIEIRRLCVLHIIKAKS